MKKKVILLIMALLLPMFVLINTLADDNNDNQEIVESYNDIMVDSPLFTKKEDYKVYVQPTTSVMDDFELLLSNSKFELYGNKESGAIRVKNKTTGFIWASDMLDRSNYFAKDTTAQAKRIRSAVEFGTRNINDAGKKAENLNVFSPKVKLTQSVKGNVVTYSVAGSSGISFKYLVELTDQGLNVKIPNDSIKETGDLRLTNITLFPYLGAAYGNRIPGYIFIPSGNGGLVRYDAQSAITSTFEQMYYGSDANRLSRENRVRGFEGSLLSIPVFGVVHGVNQNGFVTRIKKGSEIATFKYSPSSVAPYDDITTEDVVEKMGFHTVTNTFNYRQTYNLSIPGSGSILMVPEEYNKQDVEFNYTFLDNKDANYIGMAKHYRNELEKDNLIFRDNTAGSGKVHIDVLGGETEKGIIADKFVRMTTTNQLLDINEELTGKFGDKFIYTLRGFNKGGYSKQTYKNVNFDGRLGSLRDLKELDYYMYYNPIESYGSTAKAPRNTLVNVYNDEVIVTMEENVKYKYYADVDAVIDGVEKVNSKYGNVAYDALGYRLYGDKNNEYSRGDAKEMFDSSARKNPMFRPNEYFYDNATHYLNMPLYHERALFITDSVPFLQMALRGYIDYYSTFINFSTNQEIDLLKCVEYGSNLAYLISAEESYRIGNTLSNHLYATHYESNKEHMHEQILFANTVLSRVVGATIEDREVIESGVIVVTYSNNTKVYVNYTDTDYKVSGGPTVKSMSYEVM